MINWNGVVLVETMQRGEISNTHTDSAGISLGFWPETMNVVGAFAASKASNYSPARYAETDAIWSVHFARSY